MQQQQEQQRQQESFIDTAIKKAEARDDVISFGGFYLGMDYREAVQLRRAWFPDEKVEDNGRTLSYPWEERQAVHFVFAIESDGSGKVDAIRFTTPMVKKILGIKKPMAESQVRRRVFDKLELEYNFIGGNRYQSLAEGHSYCYYEEISMFEMK